MDIWLIRIGAVAAVLQAVIAVLGYFDIAPFGLDAPWMWRFLFVSVTIFTWVVLCRILWRQKKIRQSALTYEQGSLVIHSAVYGLGPGQDCDVTERVRALVRNGRLNIKVLPETFLIEDPHPNITKSLRVTCSYGEKKKVTIQRTDYESLNLPIDIED